MFRTMTFDVTAGANAEVTVSAFNGIAGKTRKLVSIGFEQGTDNWCVAYIGQDKVVEAGSDVAQFDHNFIPVDADIPEGESVKVGFDNKSAGELTGNITVVIEET